MSLKLMYITNSVEVAKIAETFGVDRIFVDMEYIGKSIRQKGMDTVQSHHTVEDVANIRSAISDAEVMVRINPIHEAGEGYISSQEEIDAVIEAGADIIMLPFFKTVEEVDFFIRYVNKRVKTILLIETPEAVHILEDILSLQNIDEVFIGLNDLSLGYGKTFMFELLADGIVEGICRKCREQGIPYGFGGIAMPGKGDLPAEYIIREHYHLGSSCVILSRSFCDITKEENIEQVAEIFRDGISKIRSVEDECQEHIDYFRKSKSELARKVKSIVEKKQSYNNKGE